MTLEETVVARYQAGSYLGRYRGTEDTEERQQLGQPITRMKLVTPDLPT
jgi:hypothetical protein